MVSKRSLLPQGWLKYLRFMEGADQTGDDLERVSYPNDAFFKEVFSEPRYAIAFFRDHLPASLVAKVDWPSLEVLPSSFVKSSLQQIHSDLLFSVKIGGRESLLYLLFEHQSTVDPTMPLRLLGYVTEIFLNHHKTRGLPLPAVLPFVLHQGPERWNVSTAFEDLFDLPAELYNDLSPFLPKFSHALLDLSQLDPSTQAGEVVIRIILDLMKLAREQKLQRFFEKFSDIDARFVPENLLLKILVYALHADSNLDVEEIYHTLSKNPELQNKTMSIAEKLLARGKAEGEARGKLEGKAEGKAEGEAKGLWIGKIQAFEEFLELKISLPEDLARLSVDELTKRHQGLRQAYEVKFKRA